MQKSATGPAFKREGTILDWTGITLRLEQSGRVRDIASDEVAAIETQWPDDYQEGLNQLDRGQTAAAIKAFSSALQQESRPWAQNIIRSKILRTQLAAEDLPNAAATFFQIIATDPQSRFAPLCPLRWDGNDNVMSQQASGWIGSDEPVVQLVGASWTIGTNPKQARPILEDLARDIDPVVAALAVGQLWNIRQQKMTAAEIDVWRNKIETMPLPARAGPRYAIAAAESRSGFTDAAIASYMRVVILYPDQPLVAAPALYQAARLLHNKGRTAAAEKLIAELKANYPASNWASRSLGSPEKFSR